VELIVGANFYFLGAERQSCGTGVDGLLMRLFPVVSSREGWVVVDGAGVGADSLLQGQGGVLAMGVHVGIRGGGLVGCDGAQRVLNAVGSGARHAVGGGRGRVACLCNPLSHWDHQHNYHLYRYYLSSLYLFSL